MHYTLKDHQGSLTASISSTLLQLQLKKRGGKEPCFFLTGIIKPLIFALTNKPGIIWKTK